MTGDNLRYITLVKTATENPTGNVFITSIAERGYDHIEELIEILSEDDYVFAIHGKGHKLESMTTIFHLECELFAHISASLHTFRRPLGNRFALDPVAFGKFLYECGYVDCWFDNPPRVTNAYPAKILDVKHHD